jgi:BASS family bile acid:Na+ symporter
MNNVLGALMLSMGITLTLDDFIRVGKEPGAVIIGFLLCYLLCPALGFALGKAFNLPLDLISGLVLVGSINGGQASNLCTCKYLDYREYPF